MSDINFGGLEIDVEATVRMPIILDGEVDPIKDDTGQEAYIEFLPWDSAPGRALDRQKHTQTVKKGFRQRSRAELRADAEAEDPLEDQIERCVALATGWYLVGPDRKTIDVPFSKGAARQMFSSPRMAWLLRSSFLFVVNIKNFMKGSSTIS